MSLAGVYDAEWRTRKINLFSVLRSFIYQLSPGQDLTRVSLPSELCHPFSMLELIAYRELQLFHILFEINQVEDGLERFLIVLKWYMGMVREETIEKKPFNPVIGEHHLCWVDHGGEEYSEFIGEQVSHHPPVTAFVTRNIKQNIKITGDVTFQVGFGTNCASVITGGQVVIHTSKEKYNMTKCMPDMMVNNVVWGDKYLMWHGGVTITCPTTGYSAYVELKEDNHRNLISGQIFDGAKNVIYNLSGIAGHGTHLQKPNSTDKIQLVDISTYRENTIQYLPPEAQVEFSTLKVWVPVKDAIIKNDMVKADETKKIIEAEQRLREAAKKAAGKVNDGLYFFRNPVNNAAGNEDSQLLDAQPWIFKESISLDTAFMEQMKRTVEEVRAKKAAEDLAKHNAPDQPPKEEEEQKDDSTECSIQ